MASAPTLLGLQSSGSSEPLIESMGDPVEELREAVEMLNDTVRERGRSQSHDQAIQELLSKVRRWSLFIPNALWTTAVHKCSSFSSLGFFYNVC